jgi:hypothetical protein
MSIDCIELATPGIGSDMRQSDMITEIPFNKPQMR